MDMVRAAATDTGRDHFISMVVFQAECEFVWLNGVSWEAALVMAVCA